MTTPINLLLAIVGLSLFAFAAARAAEEPTPEHRVVFEVTAEGPEAWDAVLNNVENVRKALGAERTQIEVVVHGAALGMLRNINQGQQSRLEGIAKSGVALAACENTMKRKNVRKEDLLPFVLTVDSGVAQVVRRQEQGWAYIRSGG